MDFFVPDRPAIHTLLAAGYPRARAVWKARRQGQYLHNKILTALRAIGAKPAAAGVLDWAALFANPAYRDLLALVHRAYRSDPDFAHACRQTSAWVLATRHPVGSPLHPTQVRHATRYLLAELPLLLDTAAIVNAPASLFCYRQPPSFIADLYRGTLALRPAAHQGFVIVDPPA